MRAFEKINTEMQKRPDDLYMEIIGHYIIDRCGADKTCEKKASAEEKTLTGAMAAVRNAAQKKAVSNCAVLTPDEVFSNIDKYFGFPADGGARERATASVSGVSVSAQAVPTAPAAVSLDLSDFL